MAASLTESTPDAEAAGEAVPVRFDGRAGEWFGIWIVNLLLTIVTLGIYGPWAKVRRNRYFYGNTTIGGRAFDYHATGGQILVGRLIVVGTLLLVGVLSSVAPAVILLFYGAMIFLVPWLLLRATRFAARNTSWSNVRFDFEATYGGAFVTYVLAPMGVALTLYATLPLLTRRLQHFTVRNHRLGARHFDCDAPIGGLYLAFAIALTAAVVAIAALGALAYVVVAPELAGAAGDLGDPEAQNALVALAPLALYAALFLAVYPATILYRAMVRNVVFAAATLQGGHRFASTVSPPRLLWIAASNAVVVVASIGLMLPWAQVRLARYMADHTAVRPNGSLDDFAGAVERDRRAIGDAFGDVEGFDVGIAAI